MIGADGESHRRLSPYFAGIRDEKAACGGRDARFSRLRGCSAIASAARCMRRNSPCWNGIAPASRLRPLKRDCGALMRLAAEAAAREALRFPRPRGRPFAEPERLSACANAFLRHADIDSLARASGPQAPAANPAADSLSPRGQRCAASRRIRRARADDSWSDVFVASLSERVEPNLGLGRATILCDYPASEAALAKLSASDPRVAERFELYACGVELANAFGELTDAERAAPPLRGGHGAEAAHLWRGLPDRRGLSRRAGAHARGERRGAGLRPACHARLRRGKNRRRAMDAGVRSGGTMRDERGRAPDREGARGADERLRLSPISAPAKRRSCAPCSRARTCSRSCRPAAASRCCSSCRRSLAAR